MTLIDLYRKVFSGFELANDKIDSMIQKFEVKDDSMESQVGLLTGLLNAKLSIASLLSSEMATAIDYQKSVDMQAFKKAMSSIPPVKLEASGNNVGLKAESPASDAKE